MKKGLIVADAGPIISLAIADALGLLHELFAEYCIPQAVWEEVTRDQDVSFYNDLQFVFEGHVRAISGKNYLSSVLDYGESEAIILYHELDAAYLLIDDKKARQAAEAMGIICVGTLGVLALAKEAGHISELKSIFKMLLQHKRYYSEDLLNNILISLGESPLN